VVEAAKVSTEIGNMMHDYTCPFNDNDQHDCNCSLGKLHLALAGLAAVRGGAK